LKLQEELILGRFGLSRLEKTHLGSHAREFLDQQGLVDVATSETVRRVAQHDRNLDLSREVPKTLQRRADQRGTRIPLILEHPIRRNLQTARGGVGVQRRRLAGNRLLLLLSR
jgi:hypothetical protein